MKKKIVQSYLIAIHHLHRKKHFSQFYYKTIWPTNYHFGELDDFHATFKRTKEFADHLVQWYWSALYFLLINFQRTEKKCKEFKDWTERSCLKFILCLTYIYLSWRVSFIRNRVFQKPIYCKIVLIWIQWIFCSFWNDLCSIWNNLITKLFKVPCIRNIFVQFGKMCSNTFCSIFENAPRTTKTSTISRLLL